VLGSVIAEHDGEWLVKYYVDGTQYPMPPHELQCTCLLCNLSDAEEEVQSDSVQLSATDSSTTDGGSELEEVTEGEEPEEVHDASPACDRGRGGRRGRRGGRGGRAGRGEQAVAAPVPAQQAAPTARGGRGRRGRPPGSGRGRGNRTRPAAIAADAALPAYLDSDSDGEQAEEEIPEGGVQGEEADTVIFHEVEWKKGGGRTHCPAAVEGFRGSAQFRLMGFEDKNELEYFLACFPTALVEEICSLMSKKGTEMFNYKFEVTKGQFWQLMGYLMYMLCHPMDLPTEDYWEEPGSTKYPSCAFVKHNLGQYGIKNFRKFRRLLSAFTLPEYPAAEGAAADPFAPIRKFADSWNTGIQAMLSPGGILVVDESMGQWLGNAMPGLMFVARKPTPNGREGHTTACQETGCIVAYEIYEGKGLMAHKPWAVEYGAGTATALRLTEPWKGTRRTVILDSAFASLKSAQQLTAHGLYMIGNVKTAHKGFPKAWLNSQVTTRGQRASATHTYVGPGGVTMEVLAAIDKDKQPMSLIGTAGSTSTGKTLTRNFTVRKATGEYFVRQAILEQWHIHEIYRACFNAIDKHNSKRQGTRSFEDTWKTFTWWVRDFQVLFGMSEVNAYLLWRMFKPGQADCSMSTYRMILCHQMMNNPWLRREQEEAAAAHGAASSAAGQHTMRKAPHGIAGRCRFCPKKTTQFCTCASMPGKSATGKRGRTELKTMWLCSTATGRDCVCKHLAGESAPMRRQAGAEERWEGKQARSRAAHMRAAHAAAAAPAPHE
jgi:hypothetical protein